MKETEYQKYQSPLCSRYGSPEMLHNFSDEYRFRTHRRIWIALAEAEKELGLDISSAQIKEMKKWQDKVNYQRIIDWEARTNHDIMAHIKAFGEQCPKAKAIIHLGATSALITDNADIVMYTNALDIIESKLVKIIKLLSDFARKYKDLTCCGFTHLQPALLTTVGKRACMWLQDVVEDYRNFKYLKSNLKILGAKGAIGTQASFLALFNGDAKKVIQLDTLFARKLGFSRTYTITGQVYPRKLDYQIMVLLSGIAQSAYKFSQDLRLLQGMGELEEPFGKEQVGSSAMPYKRNPVLSERIGSLSRFVILLADNLAFTHSAQWLERSLDDSANRRISLPDAFLGTDAILSLYARVVAGISVYKEVINKKVAAELPFMVTEEIIMRAVKLGGDRQELHQHIRQHSMEVIQNIKQGKENDLISRLKSDILFSKVVPHLEEILVPDKYVGMSVIQVDEFINKEVNPLIRQYRNGVKIV